MVKKKVSNKKAKTRRISSKKIVKAKDFESSAMVRSALKELNAELRDLTKKKTAYQKLVSSTNHDLATARKLEKAISKKESKLEVSRKNFQSKISKISEKVIKVKRVKDGLLVY